MKTKLLASLLVLGTVSPFAFAEQASTCYSARIRVTAPEHGTIILESTPVGKTIEESNILGMQYCKQTYPASTCTVAGHLIVDCK